MRWFGGKWRLAPWVIEHFPPHRVYVEPFGGAASVLLRKPRSPAEIYNDLDSEAVNLFRVLQDPKRSARLVELLELTPFARDEFMISGVPGRSAVERARRLVIRSFMGFGSNAHNARPTGFRTFTRTKPGQNCTGFRSGDRAPQASTGFRANGQSSNTTPAHDWANYPTALRIVVERLRAVVIENRDALKIIDQHDSPATLIYCDPPYLPDTRSPGNKYDLQYRAYRHELDEAGHRRLLDRLREARSAVVVSGYPHPIYNRVLRGWRRVETQAFADGARKRTECLWLNPACVDALERQALPLFFAGVS